MHPQPHPSCYLFDVDGPAPLRLLTANGYAAASLSATPHGQMAALTEDIWRTRPTPVDRA